MKFFLFILWFSVLQVTMLHAQKETKSDKILTKLSKKIKGLKTFYVEYSASVKNEDLRQNDSYTGKGWVKNNKYFATYGDNTLISNGLKTWSIIGKDKEVYESNNSDEEESVNPKKLMTLWESGFKNKFIKSDKIGNDAVDVIELYPKIPEKSNYTTITVYIGSAANELKKAVMKTTDGTVMTYSVTKFTSNPEVKDTKFTFDKKNYPGYKVIKN
ncbi:MAG: outer membrane lipoprotein carrier protein LolA [Flavobacteriia bacterium]|nr:outer membrane lipoprotein carrier protein LolA [Flavobacteriia bacterium]